MRTLFAVGFGFFTVLGQAAWLQRVGVNTLGVPDEILEKLVGVLLIDHHTSSIDDVAGLLNESFAIWRELVEVDWRMFDDISQGLVNLRVGRDFPLAKSVNNAVEANLQVPIEVKMDKWG